MKPNELYKLLKSIKYNCNGLDVDWIIIPDSDEKKIRLMFQSTASKTDIKIDLQFPVKPYKRQSVIWYGCKGYIKAYKSCNDIIMQSLFEYMQLYPEYKVEIAGHSLGGVMSVYAAEDANYRFGIYPDVITFGCPKCIFGLKTKKYIRTCISSITQYRNVNDLIPYLPPFLGYKNISEKILNIKFKLSELKNVESNHHVYGNEFLYSEV